MQISYQCTDIVSSFASYRAPEIAATWFPAVLPISVVVEQDLKYA